MSEKDLSRKKAVALRYDQNVAEAPQVKAKGTRVVADQIIELAQQNNIPIQEDTALVELLSKLELDQQIPEELFEVVAEIMAMIYRMEKRVAENEQGGA